MWRRNRFSEYLHFGMFFWRGGGVDSCSHYSLIIYLHVFVIYYVCPNAVVPLRSHWMERNRLVWGANVNIWGVRWSFVTEITSKKIKNSECIFIISWSYYIVLMKMKGQASVLCFILIYLVHAHMASIMITTKIHVTVGGGESMW